MVRRVASERGAKWFGLPIGSIVTPDKEDEAKARHGNRALPPGAVTGSNQRRAGEKSEKTEETETGVIGSKKASKELEGQVKETKGPLADRAMRKPTISGTVEVFVGSVKFSAPEGSKVYKSPLHTGRVYVVTPDNKAFVYTSNGELDLTQSESMRLASLVVDALGDKSKVTAEDDSDEKTPATLERLHSLIGLIEQAEKAGNSSLVDDLNAEFRQKSNELYPDEDPREVRTRLKASEGGSK